MKESSLFSKYKPLSTYKLYKDFKPQEYVIKVIKNEKLILTTKTSNVNSSLLKEAYRELKELVKKV